MRRVGDVDHEVARSDRGENKQVYHINLVKWWNDAVPVTFASTVPEREELGPDVPSPGPTPRSVRARISQGVRRRTLPVCNSGSLTSFRPCPVAPR